MINVVNVEERPACILFGQPVRGGQQAAWFSESEIDAARKAKNAKTLASLAPVPPELDEVVKGLARGPGSRAAKWFSPRRHPTPTPSCWRPLQPSAEAMGGQAASAETAKPAGDAGHSSGGGQARSRCDQCGIVGHGHGRWLGAAQGGRPRVGLLRRPCRRLVGSSHPQDRGRRLHPGLGR